MHGDPPVPPTRDPAQGSCHPHPGLTGSLEKCTDNLENEPPAPELWFFFHGSDSANTPGRKSRAQKASREENLGKLAHATECRASSSRYLLNTCKHTYEQSECLKYSTSFQGTPPVPRVLISPHFYQMQQVARCGSAHLQSQHSTEHKSRTKL